MNWLKRLFSEEPLVVQPRPKVAVRFEAIGGQGAHSAGKILAEAAVLGMGATGHHFSSFGSEKRGTPVRSYVRFSTQQDPIRGASPIRIPNLLVVFHEAILKFHPESLEGVLGNGPSEVDLILNSPTPPRLLRFPNGTQFRTLATLDATTIAREKKCGLNAVMLGACSSFLPEIDASVLIQKMLAFFPSRFKEANLAGFESGALVIKKSFAPFLVHQASLQNNTSEVNGPEVGNQEDLISASIGGAILKGGNSILKDHQVSRKGTIPVLNLDLCCHCGYCDRVCPDFCFDWKNDPILNLPMLQSIDLQFCKGCQKCIEICPVGALTLGNE